MKTIIDTAQNIKTLHPNADLDPFTNVPQTPETNFESFIRAKKTKTVVSAAASAASTDMSSAQQGARDQTGADSSCTHHLLNQVSSHLCLHWIMGRQKIGRSQAVTIASPPKSCFAAVDAGSSSHLTRRRRPGRWTTPVP